MCKSSTTRLGRVAPGRQYQVGVVLIGRCHHSDHARGGCSWSASPRRSGAPMRHAVGLVGWHEPPRAGGSPHQQRTTRTEATFILSPEPMVHRPNGRPGAEARRPLPDERRHGENASGVD
ncbi:Conserved hypothetical protein [Salinibacter ruber M8]|uniref:Uncharacterized protein n=1 Tax=Salinibacter ruber (strain M8) TaxID=761659 RepID=D5H851_SALRM|nr:Conserved hypothetical protein [Salinibacter ruber M8]